MIQKATPKDAHQIASLAVQMWEDSTAEELEQEFLTSLQADTGAVFLWREGDTAVAFAQCSLRRDYVEGTGSSPVGYLEGVYVMPVYQRQGIAKKLVSACEDWARRMGCTEFASDCELDNTDSLQFHLAFGFTEANRIICFTKSL